MSNAKRKYVRVCKVCRGSKQYDLIQTFQGREYVTPVKCTYCDNGNEYDNRTLYGEKGGITPPRPPLRNNR